MSGNGPRERNAVVDLFRLGMRVQVSDYALANNIHKKRLRGTVRRFSLLSREYIGVRWDRRTAVETYHIDFIEPEAAPDRAGVEAG